MYDSHGDDDADMCRVAGLLIWFATQISNDHTGVLARVASLPERVS